MTRAFDARAAIKGRALTHDPAGLLPKFETPAEARNSAHRLVKLLGRDQIPPCHGPAEEIGRCGKRIGGVRSHCGSASCPICMRPFRRWFTDGFATLAHPLRTKNGNHGVVVTVIPSGLIAPVGNLGKVELAPIVRRFSRAFSKLNLGPTIGGVDVSFNVEASSKEPGHYQVHVAFAILGHPASKKARARLHQVINEAFRLEPTADVRVKVRRLRNLVRQGSYLLKATFGRRVSYIGSDGRRNTRKLHLKPKQLAEIGLWLQRYQPIDRLLLHGVRLQQGRLVLHPRSNSSRLEVQP